MDYADEIAERLWGIADDFPATPSELKTMLAQAAREGYALGYGVNAPVF